MSSGRGKTERQHPGWCWSLRLQNQILKSHFVSVIGRELRGSRLRARGDQSGILSHNDIGDLAQHVGEDRHRQHHEHGRERHLRQVLRDRRADLAVGCERAHAPAQPHLCLERAQPRCATRELYNNHTALFGSP